MYILFSFLNKHRVKFNGMYREEAKEGYTKIII